MRELNFEGVGFVSGGESHENSFAISLQSKQLAGRAAKYVITFTRDYVIGKAVDYVVNAFSSGVGPGSDANTNPSSRDAVNGSDSMSDHFSGGTGGFGGSLGGATGGSDGGDE